MSYIGRRTFIGTALGALLWPLAGLGAGFNGDVRETLGSRFSARLQNRPRRRPNAATDLTSALFRWNAIACDCSGLDHTPPAPGEQRVFGEQIGPCRSSRAIAIAHLAMYDAAVAIGGQYRAYQQLHQARGASPQAAIAQAAHDTLVRLFPSQAAQLDVLLADDLLLVNNPLALRLGVQLGQRSAAMILAARTGDGSEIAEPKVNVDYFTSDEPGHWRQDPTTQGPLALGAYWGNVRPFVLGNGRQFRVPPPPSLASTAYARAFAEVAQLGGDGIVTPTQRTPDQTTTGIYWAYDGTPSLCAPPRLYNQIATTIAIQQRTQGLALARLFTLVNVAMADAGIAIWESKYFHDLWRPVTGLREASAGTGPTGAGDGNPATAADPSFTPLGAPASNLVGPNFTPPFPSYPSGHAGFGGALFQTLRRFYGTDQIAFSFVSDEYNGITVDHDGNVRPLLTRTFQTLSAAEEENGQSRIYLGIHWAFDKTAGIAQGRKVADYIFERALTPLRS